MFNVVNKETGMAVTVYGINGLYFLTYSEECDTWGYAPMELYRPVKPEDWEVWNNA